MLQVVLVDMHITDVERYGLKGQLYLPCHEIQMVEVSWQSKVGIAATLISRQDQFAFLYLELHQTQARGLVGLHPSGTEEQHIVFRATFLAVDLANEWRQLLQIRRITVDKYRPTIVPPADAGLPVFINVALALHEELQFALQFLPCDGMSLENVQKVSRGKRELLIEQVAYCTFFVGLGSAAGQYLLQKLIVFVHFVVLKPRQR